MDDFRKIANRHKDELIKYFGSRAKAEEFLANPTVLRTEQYKDVAIIFGFKVSHFRNYIMPDLRRRYQENKKPTRENIIEFLKKRKRNNIISQSVIRKASKHFRMPQKNIAEILLDEIRQNRW